MPSGIATECDLCGRRFDLVSGGACAKCKRALCFKHLHGSWVRRLMVDFGVAPVCVECRHGA
jgi:hypothetical protein